jgi:hypothetical protein
VAGGMPGASETQGRQAYAGALINATADPVSCRDSKLMMLLGTHLVPDAA